MEEKADPHYTATTNKMRDKPTREAEPERYQEKPIIQETIFYFISKQRSTVDAEAKDSFSKHGQEPSV